MMQNTKINAKVQDLISLVYDESGGQKQKRKAFSKWLKVVKIHYVVNTFWVLADKLNENYKAKRKIKDE